MEALRQANSVTSSRISFDVREPSVGPSTTVPSIGRAPSRTTAGPSRARICLSDDTPRPMTLLEELARDSRNVRFVTAVVARVGLISISFPGCTSKYRSETRRCSAQVDLETTPGSGKSLFCFSVSERRNQRALQTRPISKAKNRDTTSYKRAERTVHWQIDDDDKGTEEHDDYNAKGGMRKPPTKKRKDIELSEISRFIDFGGAKKRRRSIDT
jgi:hypothetical protein